MEKVISCVPLGAADAGSGRRGIAAEVQEALNAQLTSELESFYLYTAIALQFDGLSVGGCANWFRKQAEEELAHFRKLSDFMTERGIPVVLPRLDQPDLEIGSVPDAFRVGLANEQALTRQVHDLYGLAQAHGEYDVSTFLQWFIDEQREEEALFDDIIGRFEIGSDSPGVTLLLMDQRLAGRQE